MSARLNYKHLRYFWAVANNGNLTRAAEDMNISQSALSVQIQKLEEQLGHQLFERRGRKLILTEAGQIALEHANIIFATGDELFGTLGTGDPQQQRILRVGAQATLSRNFQLQFLRPLIGNNSVRISIQSGNLTTLLEALHGHRLDVVLTTQLPLRDPDTPWVSNEISRDPVSLIGKPRAKYEGLRPVEILAEAPLFLPSASSTIRDRFDAFIDRQKITPNIVAEVDDMAMLRLLTREGTGVAAIPPIVVKDELKTGQLVDYGQIPDIWEAFHAITLRRRFPNPVLADLMAAISGAGESQSATY